MRAHQQSAPDRVINATTCHGLLPSVAEPAVGRRVGGARMPLTTPDQPRRNPAMKSRHRRRRNTEVPPSRSFVSRTPTTPGAEAISTQLPAAPLWEDFRQPDNSALMPPQALCCTYSFSISRSSRIRGLRTEQLHRTRRSQLPVVEAMVGEPTREDRGELAKHAHPKRKASPAEAGEAFRVVPSSDHSGWMNAVWIICGPPRRLRLTSVPRPGGSGRDLMLATS